MNSNNNYNNYNNNSTSIENKNSPYDSENKPNPQSNSFEFSFKCLSQRFSDLVIACRQSRSLVLLVVFIALFFDNMLLTTVGKMINYILQF